MDFVPSSSQSPLDIPRRQHALEFKRRLVEETFVPEIMDMLVMREASNWSAGRAESTAVKKQVHRRYAIELKRRIVEETFAPGASVSVVARRHDVDANLVFTWQQKYHRGELGQSTTKIGLVSPNFIPVGQVANLPAGAGKEPFARPKAAPADDSAPPPPSSGSQRSIATE